jgi:cytochrome P450
MKERWRKWGVPDLPRGPTGLVLPMLRYIIDPYGALPALARRYGDPFFLPIPGTRGTVVTGAPDGIKTIMSADPETFRSFKLESTELILGERSLFFQSGAAHRAARKVLSTPFHGSRVAVWSAIMERAADARLDEIRPGAPFDLQKLTGWIALEVIIRAIFGVRDPARVARFHQTIILGMESMGPAVIYFKWLRRDFGGIGPWARAQRMVRALRALVEEEIASRRASGERGEDVLSALLEARFDDGSAMEDVDIRDKLYDMIIAGYETTAVAMAWAAWEVARRPELRARLTDEIDSLGDDRDPRRLARLTLLDAVCAETLRLHPNFIMLTRLLQRPLRLQGWEVPDGVGVTAAIGLAHFNERIFPRAHEFQPERFIGRSYSPFEYLPFGGGAQRCLGAVFALHEMKVVLAELFRRFELTAVKRSIRNAARSVTVGPRGGVWIIARPRARAEAARRAAAASP